MTQAGIYTTFCKPCALELAERLNKALRLEEPLQVNKFKWHAYQVSIPVEAIPHLTKKEKIHITSGVK